MNPKLTRSQEDVLAAMAVLDSPSADGLDRDTAQRVILRECKHDFNTPEKRALLVAEVRQISPQLGAFFDVLRERYGQMIGFAIALESQRAAIARIGIERTQQAAD